jgi:hypothetical protein
MSDEAMAIVAELAASSPFRRTGEALARWTECRYCDAEAFEVGAGVRYAALEAKVVHAPGCLWVRAVTLVYPVTGGRLTERSET